MSFKIKQNGVVKDLKLPAASIEVLDMEDNYTTNNLEEVLQELGESDGVYISNDEPDKDGIWISNEHTTQSGENKTFSALKDYINENIIPKINTNEERINELSNPNLLINGDFRVNTKGKQSYSEWGKDTVDKWINHTKQVDIQSDGSIIVTMDAQYGSINQPIEDVSIYKNKTVVLSGEIEVLEGGVYCEIPYNTSDSGEILCYNSFDIGKHKFSVRGTFPDKDLKSLRVCITNRITSQSRVKIKWLKLEIGSQATPFIPKPYVQELQDCLMYNGDTLTTPYFNPNLLINGDFQVWQRGTSFSNLTFGVYTADRWNVATPNGDMTGIVISKNAGMKIQNPNKHSLFVRYYFETDHVVNVLFKKTLTLSVKVLGDDNIYSLTWEFNNSSSTNATYKDFTKLRLELGYNKDKNRLYLQIKTSETAIEYEYIKLELGTVATPFTPRPYAEELAMCQRYYEKTDMDTQFIGNFAGGNDLTFTYRYSVEKRVAPTIHFSHWEKDNTLFLFSKAVSQNLPCNVTKNIPKEVKWAIIPNAGSYLFGESAVAFGQIIADAEIY